MLYCKLRQGVPPESPAYVYLTNQSNVAFCRGEEHGVRTEEDLQSWLHASFLALVAAELDRFSYTKVRCPLTRVGMPQTPSP